MLRRPVRSHQPHIAARNPRWQGVVRRDAEDSVHAVELTAPAPRMLRLLHT